MFKRAKKKFWLHVLFFFNTTFTIIFIPPIRLILNNIAQIFQQLLCRVYHNHKNILIYNIMMNYEMMFKV